MMGKLVNYMNKVTLTKKIVIEFDVINNNLNFLNEDGMTYIELMGALEYVKMMIYKDWMGN